jgi:hypothetical protein
MMTSRVGFRKLNLLEVARQTGRLSNGLGAASASNLVIARLDRATQYSRDGRVQPRSRGVLDRPVKQGDDSLVVAGGSLAMTWWQLN